MDKVMKNLISLSHIYSKNLNEIQPMIDDLDEEEHPNQPNHDNNDYLSSLEWNKSESDSTDLLLQEIEQLKKKNLDLEEKMKKMEIELNKYKKNDPQEIQSGSNGILDENHEDQENSVPFLKQKIESLEEKILLEQKEYLEIKTRFRKSEMNNSKLKKKLQEALKEQKNTDNSSQEIKTQNTPPQSNFQELSDIEKDDLGANFYLSVHSNKKSVQIMQNDLSKLLSNKNLAIEELSKITEFLKEEEGSIIISFNFFFFFFFKKLFCFFFFYFFLKNYFL